MGKKLYVGNLTYGVTDSALEQMFAPHGTVQSAQVIMDRDTGRSKGFGFVEMSSDQEAQAAIAALNGQQMEGRSLTVNEAKPREDRGGSRGGAGGSRGGFGGGRRAKPGHGCPFRAHRKGHVGFGEPDEAGQRPALPLRPGRAMNPQKTLREREMELQALLTTPAGRDALQELGARYSAAAGRFRPARASVITYILVYERERGLIRS